MKIAIIGSRSLSPDNIGNYIQENDEIVSGGAKGVDACAEEYAKSKGLKLTRFLPQYDRYGNAAPLIRNKQIVEYADKVIAFWDGKSKGTRYVIEYAKKIGRACEVILCQ